MNYEFFERLNSMVPGSVAIDRENSTVTLTGWKLEEFNNYYKEQGVAKLIEEKTCSVNSAAPEDEGSYPRLIFLVDAAFGRRKPKRE